MTTRSKGIAPLALVLGLVLLVSACNGDEPAATEPDESGVQSPEDTDAAADSDEPVDLAELEAAAAEEGSVLWYTAIPTEASEAVAAAFTERYPDVQAEVQRLPSFQLWERFRTENAAGSNVADVVSFSDWGVEKQAIEEGLLEPYLPSGIEGVVDERFIDPNGYYWNNRITTTGIVYNTELVPEEHVPETWDDLLDPWWGEENRLGIGDPAESAAIYGAYWQMARNDDIGPEFFQRLGEHDPVLYAQGGQQLNAVTAGEHVGTIVVDYRGWQMIADGVPVQVVYPPEGIGYTVDFNSLVAEAPHPNAARLFLEFLGSQEGADVLARELGAYLSRTDVPAYPEGVDRPSIDEVPLLPLDLDAAAEDYEEFNAQFNEWIGR